MLKPGEFFRKVRPLIKARRRLRQQTVLLPADQDLFDVWASSQEIQEHAAAQRNGLLSLARAELFDLFMTGQVPAYKACKLPGSQRWFLRPHEVSEFRFAMAREDGTGSATIWSIDYTRKVSANPRACVLCWPYGAMRQDIARFYPGLARTSVEPIPVTPDQGKAETSQPNSQLAPNQARQEARALINDIVLYIPDVTFEAVFAVIQKQPWQSILNWTTNSEEWQNMVREAPGRIIRVGRRPRS